ncbi:MAG: hypothetical protein WC150_08115 [Bacteroidia bacterium]
MKPILDTFILFLKSTLVTFLIVCTSSCNNSNDKINADNISAVPIVNKANLDSLLVKSQDRKLPIKDIRNIDTIRGYKGLTLGLNLYDIELGSFERRIYMNGLLTILRSRHRANVNLFFYKSTLVKILIDRYWDHTEDGVVIERQDLVNTFGNPNIEKKIDIDKGYDIIGDTYHEYNSSKKATKLKWISPSNIEVSYYYNSEIVKAVGKEFKRDILISLFEYRITDLNMWSEYENERSKILKSEELENKRKSKDFDSLNVRNAQNNL